MRSIRTLLAVLGVISAASPAFGQIIEFETSGLRYQALTRNGLTIMFAQLPTAVREYSVLQVAVSNGSKVSWTVKPEDFVFERADGSRVVPSPARAVVEEVRDRGSRSDVIKLVTAYEAYLYGNPRYKATNGYEARRQNALAEVSSQKIKAAAAASAIVFVYTRLKPGESTDGAVFYPTAGKSLEDGKLLIRAADSLFEFPISASE